MKICDDLYAFVWRDMRANNANTFFINGTKKILIDPGHRHLFGHVKQELARLSVSPDMIDVVIATHGHPDHFEAAGLLENALFAMGKDEYRALREMAGAYLDIPDPSFFLQEGDLTIGGHTFRIIAAPGHSPGSLCLYWPVRKALICGDVVFNRGIGRTDLPGGSGPMLKKSIQSLSQLEVEYLLPGHGDIVAGMQAVAGNFRFIEEHWFGYLS